MSENDSESNTNWIDEPEEPRVVPEPAEPPDWLLDYWYKDARPGHTEPKTPDKPLKRNLYPWLR